GIYNEQENALYVVRDRIGVKPLYFAVFDGEFVFGSEIKALLAHPKAEADIDPYAMVHYLAFLTTPSPMTMFKGIYKLPAGCWLRVGPAGDLRCIAITNRSQASRSIRPTFRTCPRKPRNSSMSTVYARAYVRRWSVV